MNVTAYMLRPAELAKYARLCAAAGEPDTGRGALPIIEAMAAGDADLFEAMWAFWNFAHALDDVLDDTLMPPDQREAGMAIAAALVDALMLGAKDLTAYNRFARWYRGSISGAVEWSPEQRQLALAAADDFVRQMRTNSFALGHAKSLHALFISAMLRCLAGDDLRLRGDAKAAAVVGCGDVDVLIHFVYLARGWAAAREWASLRDYDQPEPVKEAV